MKKKAKVLFLSTGNSTRSQMGEGFLRALGSEEFEATSTGIEPGELYPLAIEVMKEVDIDISGQHAKNVAESLKEHFGYVITVSNMVRERAPIFPFTLNLLHWSLEDPGRATGSAEERKRVFRRVRNEIQTKVREFVWEIAEKDHQKAKAAAA